MKISQWIESSKFRHYRSELDDNFEEWNFQDLSTQCPAVLGLQETVVMMAGSLVNLGIGLVVQIDGKRVMTEQAREWVRGTHEGALHEGAGSDQIGL